MTLERKSKNSSFKWLVCIAGFFILCGIIWFITSTIREDLLQDDPMLFELKETIQPLADKYPSVKNLKLYKGNKSYTINKEKIYLCLKDENGDYYPKNHLVYVLLHELSHYLNKEDIGHTQKFHDIFEKLLEESHELGLYNASIPPIKDYCNY